MAASSVAPYIYSSSDHGGLLDLDRARGSRGRRYGEIDFKKKHDSAGALRYLGSMEGYA